jgi:hemolysin III
MLTGRNQVILLVIVWSGALTGICFRLFWFSATRWLYTLIYLAMGWVAVMYVGEFAQYPQAAVVVLLIVGGLFYTAGGIVYGRRRPNPSRRWFGFHEVFHALTITAFVSQYLAVSLATYSLR